MKKEVIISILFGFGVGLLITFGIYQTQNSKPLELISPIGKDQENIVLETPPVGTSNILNIVSPIDQSYFKEPKIKIIGTTSPGSVVAIVYEKGEKVINSERTGNFETEIPLDSGENEIEITSISENGERVSKIITIVYTTAEI